MNLNLTAVLKLLHNANAMGLTIEQLIVLIELGLTEVGGVANKLYAIYHDETKSNL